jgi:CRISPR/Cas system CSM-associated protein Csm2 small subunit
METVLKSKINDWKINRGLEPYAPTTIAKYLSDVRKLAPPNYDDMEWALDTKQVSKKLHSFKPTTQRNYYNSLLIALYASGTKKGEGVARIYEAKRDMLNAQYENQGGNTIKQQEILKNVNKESIDKMLSIMKKDLRTRQTHMVYVMINIYKRYAFRNDVAGMEIFPSHIYDEIADSERIQTNYLVLGKPPESMSFILNNYKTSRKYGEKVFEIADNELQIILNDWIQRKTNNNPELLESNVVYLFDWATGNPLSRNDISHALSATFNKYLGYSVSTTLLRKIYGHTIQDINSASDDEVDTVINQANISGHSVKTKAKVYHT